MATEKDEIMARSGLEDNLASISREPKDPKFVSAAAPPPISHENTAPAPVQATAPRDFLIGFVEGPAAKLQPHELYYRDTAEAKRFVAIAQSKGPSGQIIRDLAASRNNCSKASYMTHLCLSSKREHQAKYCAPTYVAELQCLAKLARATDKICRPEFWALSTCTQKHGKGAPECLSAWTAFDTCTEDF